jgi:hypothetical protein
VLGLHQRTSSQEEASDLPRDRVAALSRLAEEVGASAIAADAAALNARLSDGRFYVACVGQFKRGKSTLLNALVGQSLLPAGVVPITTAVTVLRYGERVRARVRLGAEWHDIAPSELAAYVSEEQNPANEKGVSVVEVFVPNSLLASGMCLVDTPGIGSVITANTEATRAFVPHIDAALVVIGADPPISADEVTLISPHHERPRRSRPGEPPPARSRPSRLPARCVHVGGAGAGARPQPARRRKARSTG